MADRTKQGLLPTVMTVSWLTAVWLMLWGKLSPLIVGGGLLVAVVLVIMTPLPPLGARVRPRVFRLLAELGRLVYEIVRSTVDVAWAVLRTGPRTPVTVTTVPLRTQQHVLMVLTASWLTLVPGTLVVGIEIRNGRLDLHVLPTPEHGADEVREDAARTEQRLLAALGAAPEDEL